MRGAKTRFHRTEVHHRIHRRVARNTIDGKARLHTRRSASGAMS